MAREPDAGACITCADCGKVLEKPPKNVLADKTAVCDECFEKYAKCVECENFFPKSEMVDTTGGDKVCKECAEEEYDQCERCLKYARKDEGIGYIESTNEMVCEGCEEEHFVTCAGCGDVIPDEESFARGQEIYCADCANQDDDEEEEGEHSCIFCGALMAHQEWICDECARKHLSFGEKEVPAEAVLAVYPDLDERIKMMFLKSVTTREWIRGLGTAINSLQKAFEQISLDFTGLKYRDPRSGAWREMSMLSSPRNRMFKDLPEEKKASVRNAIQLVYNKARDRKSIIDEKSSQAFPIVMAALRYRMYREKKVVGLRRSVDAVRGIYKYGDLFFDISDDPVDIMMKSTGQTWEGISCEKFTGNFKEGPLSDILRSNMVVFIKDGIDGKALARIMLRWCETEKSKIGFGIEKIWYHGAEQKTEKNRNTEIARAGTTGIEAAEATAFIEEILKDAGAFDYETCTTPYKYAGYSDTMGRGMTKIKYKK